MQQLIAERFYSLDVEQFLHSIVMNVHSKSSNGEFFQVLAECVEWRVHASAGIDGKV